MCGRVIAEVEAVLKLRGCNVTCKHSGYLINEHAGERNHLINIETGLLGIQAFCMPKVIKGGIFSSDKMEKSGLAMPEFDGHYMQHLLTECTRLHYTDPAYKVVVYAIEALYNQNPTALPENVKHSVVSMKDREELSSFQVKSNQMGILALNNTVDKINETIDKKLNDPNTKW